MKMNIYITNQNFHIFGKRQGWYWVRILHSILKVDLKTIIDIGILRRTHAIKENPGWLPI